MNRRISLIDRNLRKMIEEGILMGGGHFPPSRPVEGRGSTHPSSIALDKPNLFCDSSPLFSINFTPLFRQKPAIMLSRTSRLGDRFRLACFGGFLGFLLCWGMTGCANNKWNLLGEGFHDDETTTTVRKARGSERSTNFGGLSKKSQDIERDLGAE
jgi:hypothetical protein